jgi:hypothetical protein
MTEVCLSAEWIASKVADLIKARCEHCITELKKHIHEAHEDVNSIAWWPSGHFNLKTYEAMLDFLKDPIFYNLTDLVALEALTELIQSGKAQEYPQLCKVLLEFIHTGWAFFSMNSHYDPK